MKLSAAVLLAALLPPCAFAQMDHASMPEKHEAAPPSQSLLVTGFEGRIKTLSINDMKAMTHVTVNVTNGHSARQESYSGVPVKDLLELVAVPRGGNAEAAKQKLSPRMTVIIAGATDNFHVALTLCDIDPGCRSGQAIVADSMDGQPLTKDGAFKLILTEDKMPGRWVRNLNTLTEKNLGNM